MRVEVYRNLHTGTWSVRALEGPSKGRVISHPKAICLKNCTLVVQPAGNARVRNEGRKNVHAFVRGEVMMAHDHSIMEPYADADQVTYNPYENTTFVDKETGEPVTEADYVYLDAASYPGVYPEWV